MFAFVGGTENFGGVCGGDSVGRIFYDHAVFFGFVGNFGGDKKYFGVRF